MTPARPRKLSRLELAQRFPLECHIDGAARVVTVPAPWRKANLRPLTIRPGLPPAWLHKDALPYFEHWRELLAAAALLDRIVTNDGGFVPRLMRGRNVPAHPGGLSLHSYGVALDTNARSNKRGTRGAQLGEPGCLLELVPYAYQAGLVWGGDWLGELCDPMHWEVGARYSGHRNKPQGPTRV